MAGLNEAEIIGMAGQCARLLDEKKAQDIIVMDLMKINSYLDYFIICTANSHIHSRALAKEVQRFFKSVGLSERTKPGLDSAWIALDYNEIVVHIFTREMREFYRLEKLWADAGRIEF